MIHIIKKVIGGIDAINDRVGKTASFLMPLLIIFESYEVISRYVFGRPTIWISELSAMLFGAFIMLGGGYTLYRGAHANMDIVYAALPKRGKALLDLITFSLFLAFVGVLFWQGWQMAWRSVLMLEHDSTEWAPPLYYFKMTLPIGAGLLLLQGIAKFLKDIIILVKGDF
jgi:TRAP-type mannitol/chloroaromatic compound transport system permease small subunit